jgi:hypothetical protein
MPCKLHSKECEAKVQNIKSAVIHTSLLTNNLELTSLTHLNALRVPNIQGSIKQRSDKQKKYQKCHLLGCGAM